MTEDRNAVSLFLDTATNNLALFGLRGLSHYRVDLGDPKRCLERTHLGIDMVLSALHATWKDIRKFYCLLGPGSNTGIRLGLTIPRTVYALDDTIKIYGIGTLELMLQKDRDGIAVLSDRNGNLYCASYKDGALVEGKIAKDKIADLPEGKNLLVEGQDGKARLLLKDRKVVLLDVLHQMVECRDSFKDYSDREKEYLPHYAFVI